MKAVAYARYSSDNQRTESIIAQMRAIHAYALKNNIKIVREYIDEAETATNDERPDFQRMIDDLARIRPNFILVHKLDRFARNRDDAGHYRWLFKKMGGSRLIAVDQDFGDTPEAALVESNIEGVAEYFSKNLSREVKKGLYESVVQGMHCGGIPPLGYNIGQDGKYVINEYEADAVKLIFQGKLEGKSYPAIIQELNAAGYTTKKGGPFGKNSLHDILRNEKYIGTYVYRKTSPNNSRVAADPLATIRLDGAVPAIIDREIFERVQEMMDNRKCRPRDRSTTVYLLTGFARCYECGQALVGGSEYQNGKKYEYYRCNNAKRTAGTGCTNRSRNKKDALESEVITSTRAELDRIKEYDLEEFVAAVYDEYTVAMEAQNIVHQDARRELNKTQGEIDNLVASIAAGVDASIIAPKLNDLGKKKAALERKIHHTRLIITLDMIREQVLKVLNLALDPDDPVQCRHDLAAILDYVIVSDAATELHFKPFGIIR